ncbi:MAG: hypothetical protein HUU37_06135 [Bdellovibrionales bacterium]|nr:hypothetical protein [Bdellovibrionales bacterium]
MKKLIAVMAIAMTSTAALADGFQCESADGLVAKVYNHASPEAGTRNAAVMVLSDSSVGAGRRTIARFTDVNGTLGNSGAVYLARVDHRFNDSGRKGELIAGTKIAFIRDIELRIDFTYGAPMANGDHAPGALTLVKRNGEVTGLEMDCYRYLKN